MQQVYNSLNARKHFIFTAMDSYSWMCGVVLNEKKLIAAMQRLRN